MPLLLPAPAAPLCPPRSPLPLPATPAGVGAHLRAELATWRPALAIRTAFSPLEGARLPGDWGACLAAWDGDGPVQRVLLADRDDVAGLPAALAAWGRGRVAVGATLRLGNSDEGSADDDVVVLAPSAAAYARLCRLLSDRNASAEPQAASKVGWWHPADAAFSAGETPALPGRPTFEAPRAEPGCDACSGDWSGLVALVRTTALTRPLREQGAEVWWRSDLGCDRSPDPALPSAALPLMDAISAADHAGAAVRRAVSARESRVHTVAGTLTDLLAMRDAAVGHEDLIEAGKSLLARCVDVPGGIWHMPPSRYADAEVELARRAEAGVRRRYGSAPAPVRERLEHELRVIAAKGFSGYILTVADLAAGRRTCGRGSGASSLVCYALGITNVDPVRYQLLFERFLNPARTDPPDLDVDFPWDERDAVLAAAIRTYGREHVAMVANHLYLRRWSALRTVARAFGRSDGETTAVRQQVRAHERYGSPLRLAEPWPGILEQSSHLIGLPHHQGLHCGGIVITPTPLRDLVPVHPAAKTIAFDDDESGDDDTPPLREPVPAISWEKDGAEAMGLVKIDLLGNRSLAVVRDCVADLAEDGITIDEARWKPADDPITRKLVASGDTLGCFYIESPAMRQLQAKAASGDFDRLVVHSSIIRPAANRWIAEYLTRLHHHRTTGRHEDAWYPHPALRGLLSESFGILSYQEDVMLSAIRIAGFNDRQANALRKALGLWDTQARLTRFADDFRRGAESNGATPEAIATVWGMISSFAGYSFCKAHSASYAMVSFQCAYLKAHHPAHFLARVVANEGGFYGPAAYLEDARRRGIRILAPCVAASLWATRREGGDAIRCGLQLVPGFSPASGGRIVAERARRPFTGLSDLRRRCRLSAGQLSTLARSGALDALLPGRHRAEVEWVATAVGLEPTARYRGVEDDDGVTRIFPLPEPVDPRPPTLPELSPRQTAWQQFQTLGFCPPGHPIWFADPPAARTRCRQITAALAKRRVAVLAWPITRKQVEAHPKAKPGKTAGPPEPMAFVTLEDETGLVETVWFPAAYRAYGPCLDRGVPVRIEGTVEVEFGVAAISVTRAACVELRPDAP